MWRYVESETTLYPLPNTSLLNKKKGRKNSSANAVSTGSLQVMTRSPGTLLPNKLMSTFRFQRTLALTTGAGAYAAEQYSMNSPYDPLYTVGGGICTGWAALMALYSKCYVHTATIKFQPTLFSAATPYGDIAFVLPVRSDEAAAGVVLTADMVTESQVSTFNVCTASSLTNYLAITDVRSPSEFQGLGPRNRTSTKDNLSASVSTDPVIQPAWYVGLIAAAGHTLSGFVLIEYTCELYRPNSLSDA